MSSSSSSVSLGGITTGSTGGPRLGTTLFGVDTEALIKSLADAKNIPNLKRQDLIDKNTAKLSAYSSLESLLGNLNRAAAQLSNPAVTSGTTDVFRVKQTLSNASGSIEASKLVGVSATETAPLGSYQLTINRIAKIDTISSSLTAVDATTTAPLTSAGTLVLNGENIDLTTSMSLNQIRDAINAKSDVSKVSASVIKVDDTNFKLVLKGTTTGKAITIADNLGNTLIGELGLAASGATNQSLSAELILDGTTVYRADNSVNDLIPGVSLELFQPDVGKPITISVDNNLGAASEGITAFLDAYNSLVDYVAAQRAVGADGTISEEQTLYNDTFMLSTYRNLQSIIAAPSAGVETGNLRLLRDVGITINSDNKLQITDQKKLEDGLLDKIDQLKALFGFQANASAGLSVVNRPTQMGADVLGKTITVNITATDTQGRPTAATLNLEGVGAIAATIENGFIKGAAGTALEDFVIGYDGGVLANGATYTGTFKPTQGLADQIAASLKGALDPEVGDLKTVKDALTASSDRLNGQIITLNSQIDLYRARLQLQFEAAQRAISALESSQNSIDALFNNSNNNN